VPFDRHRRRAAQPDRRSAASAGAHRARADPV